MNPIENFPDPDNICQMEYRAIYEHIKETLDDCPEEERFELAVSMLEEFESWAKELKDILVFTRKS